MNWKFVALPALAVAGIVAAAVGEREFHHGGHSSEHGSSGDHSGEGK